MTAGCGATILLDDASYLLVAMLDEFGARTSIESEVCTLLLQDPADERPQGVQQAYKIFPIDKGSLTLTKVIPS